jgi:hypothetical protein
MLKIIFFLLAGIGYTYIVYKMGICEGRIIEQNNLQEYQEIQEKIR